MREPDSGRHGLIIYDSFKTESDYEWTDNNTVLEQVFEDITQKSLEC